MELLGHTHIDVTTTVHPRVRLRLPLVKNRPRDIQHRPEVLDGFITETGLVLEPS
ncbi:hypothetical protein ACLVWQ_19425 [Streptomyces sp. CWNU-52B]|uniref:hypothetical protein n=1 Tax=unclassified Streptomyces TaxID=2593676 RepID=UPI0039C03D1C